MIRARSQQRRNFPCLGMYAAMNEIDAVAKVNTAESMTAGSKKSRVSPCRVRTVEDLSGRVAGDGATC